VTSTRALSALTAGRLGAKTAAKLRCFVDDDMHCAPPALHRCPVVGRPFVSFFLLGLVSLFTFLLHLVRFVTFTFIPISILVLILTFPPAFPLSLGLVFVIGKSSASGAIDSALDSLSGSTETLEWMILLGIR
jgi:hypothetical protein